MVTTGNVFRGKSVEYGRWIIGFYSGPCGAKLIDVHWISEYKSPFGTPFRVDPATVGECTKLQDKNGTWIFDGDITRLVLDNGEVRHFTVKIETLERMIVTTYPGFEPATAAVQITGVIFDWHGHKLLPCVDENGVSDVAKMEVVGNIYDNPEILKEGQNGQDGELQG